MIIHSPSSRILAKTVELFRSPADRARGLLKFKQAPENYAGIFYLPLGGFFPLIHTFGMKFPIDLFFLDRRRRVVFQRRSVDRNKFVLPWKKLLGGCAYLVEFSNCDVGSVGDGDEISWSEDARA